MTKLVVVKVVLISLMQFSVNRDAQSTNRSITAGNKEANPIARPFAGHKSMYLYSNSTAGAWNYMLWKTKSKKKLKILIPLTIAGIATEFYLASHNNRLANERSRIPKNRIE